MTNFTFIRLLQFSDYVNSPKRVLGNFQLIIICVTCITLIIIIIIANNILIFFKGRCGSCSTSLTRRVSTSLTWRRESLRWDLLPCSCSTTRYYCLQFSFLFAVFNHQKPLFEVSIWPQHLLLLVVFPCLCADVPDRRPLRLPACGACGSRLRQDLQQRRHRGPGGGQDDRLWRVWSVPTGRETVLFFLRGEWYLIMHLCSQMIF